MHFQLPENLTREFKRESAVKLQCQVRRFKNNIYYRKKKPMTVSNATIVTKQEVCCNFLYLVQF